MKLSEEDFQWDDDNVMISLLEDLHSYAQEILRHALATLKNHSEKQQKQLRT